MLRTIGWMQSAPTRGGRYNPLVQRETDVARPTEVGLASSLTWEGNPIMSCYSVNIALICPHVVRWLGLGPPPHSGQPAHVNIHPHVKVPSQVMPR